MQPVLRPKALFFDVLTTALVSIFCLAVFWVSMGLGPMRLDVPLIYEEDALQYMFIIDAFSAPGGEARIQNAGAPFGTQNLDFPNADATNLFIASALAPATAFGLRFNLFFLATVVLTAVSGYAVARSMGLSRVWSAAVTIVFSLLPFHSLRVGHLFYCNYSPAAIALWIGVSIGKAGDVSTVERSGARRIAAALLLVIACIWCGSCGVYYAVFTCLAIFVSTVFAAIHRSSWAPVKVGWVALVVIVLTISAQLAQEKHFEFLHGKNDIVAKRGTEESEVYGLKIAQLLLPIANHAFPAVGELNKKYSSRAPLVNENATASLGLIGSLAFLLAILWLCFRKANDLLPWHFRMSCVLVLVMLLYATIGGFGSLFSLLVTPEIRSINRISTFIGYASLVAAAGIIQHVSKNTRRRWMSYGGALLCIPVAVIDQIPFQRNEWLSQHEVNRVRFDNDKRFADALTNQVKAGSLVFQLPFAEYPETGFPNDNQYVQFRDILHARTLRWTFGAMKGRPESNWLRSVVSLEPQLFVETLSQVGFSALVIDNRYLSDLAKRQIEAFSSQNGVKTIISDDRTQTAFVTGAAETGNRAVAPETGWYPNENWGVWAKGDASLALSDQVSASSCEMRLTLTTLRAREIDVLIDGKVLSHVSMNDGATADLRFMVPAKVRTLQLKTNVAAQVPGNGDPRLISFGWTYTNAPVCVTQSQKAGLAAGRDHSS